MSPWRPGLAAGESTRSFVVDTGLGRPAREAAVEDGDLPCPGDQGGRGDVRRVVVALGAVDDDVRPGGHPDAGEDHAEDLGRVRRRGDAARRGAEVLDGDVLRPLQVRGEEVAHRPGVEEDDVLRGEVRLEPLARDDGRGRGGLRRRGRAGGRGEGGGEEGEEGEGGEDEG